MQKPKSSEMFIIIKLAFYQDPRLSHFPLMVIKWLLVSYWNYMFNNDQCYFHKSLMKMLIWESTNWTDTNCIKVLYSIRGLMVRESDS